MSFILATDTSCDIPRGELRARGIEYKPLVYTIEGAEHPDEFDCDEQYKAFYSEIRAGKLASTSMINLIEHEEFFTMLVDKYTEDIVYVTLSSGLSASHSSAVQAAENVFKSTGRKVYVVDSRGATIMTRHVVDEAQKLRDSGLSAQEAVEQLADFVAHLQTWFMPVDLMHLKRGGRVSGPAAIIGTALKIKPILNFSEAGGLVVAKKIHGVAKGLAFMIDMFKADAVDGPSKFYIANADSEYAPELLERAKEARPDWEGEIGWIGPVIGAHTGCGAVGISFLSKKTRDK
ncbi:MAG: DegV family protein [Clostridiales bacterium]|nr:DegV family protein [Clostridiales bacterium]